MSEADPGEISNQVGLHRAARWSRSSTIGLFNGLHGIARSKGRGSLASQIAGSSFPLHVRPDRSRSTAASPARQRSAAKRHQSSARSYRPAPDRLASHPSSLRTILVLVATRTGLEWRPGGDRMQPETNRAFAQGPPGKAASGHPLRVSLRGAPTEGRAPPGCRKC